MTINSEIRNVFVDVKNIKTAQKKEPYINPEERIHLWLIFSFYKSGHPVSAFVKIF